jgi:orotidine-5'-phosphate decarboxylase
VFGDDLEPVLPSYSREVLAAGPGVADLRAAADRALGDCQRVLAVAA